ncbi:MAG: DNA repair protein RadA [Deltaproteobacteria bacterium]|nr:DNA repair protein RadA [Deltaproteobacteria bacterium]
MAKSKIYYICARCGHKSPKWLGRCPECGSWDSMEEILSAPRGSSFDARTGQGPITLKDLPPGNIDRELTGLEELDRVLGGGVVPGSVVLLAGDPGIGKSTLLLQAAAELGRRGQRLLYVSGEESLSQLKLRAERLSLDLSLLHVAAETSLEAILALVKEYPWDMLAIDSVQAISSTDAGAAPGSLVQIRETASRLIKLAKTSNKPVWLVGHVTKDGSIAGPKVLEHLVDTVLYFEGERAHNLRILRAFKNRFGSVNEIGVFEMKDTGLTEVTNPSALFLAERPQKAPGSVVVPTIEGTRPVLIELQALVSVSGLAMPRRQALGVDPARLSLLAAVLEKKVGLKLFDRDIFINVTGGIRVVEPAIDLGLVAGVVSSYFERPVDYEAVFLGEVGLAGEVRGVSRLDIRLKEAAKLGFKRAVLYQKDFKSFDSNSDLELIGVNSIADLLEWLAR